MEDSTGEGIGPVGPGSKKKWMRWSVVAIISVGIVGVLIASLFIITAIANPNQNHQILQAGDFLHYDFSGSYNNSSFTSYMGTNVTVDSASESRVSYDLMSDGYTQIPKFGHDFKIFYGAPSSSQIIGTEQIATPFGPKCVTTVCWIHYDIDEVILIDVGVDSYLVYRWTVSSMTGLYHYTYELTATNNTMIHSADKTMRSVNVEAPLMPTHKAGSYSFGYFQPGTGYYDCLYGSVQVSQGQHLHYIIGGNATVYVMDLNDLKSIAANGQFQYREGLSRLAGNPGETNVTVEPGIYWFVVKCKGAEEAVEYDGQMWSAYFVFYFGPRS